MIKYLFIAQTIFLLMAGVLSAPFTKGTELGKVVTSYRSEINSTLATSISNEDTLQIPSEIKIPSSLGEVVFPHKLHLEDLEIKCVECHHQLNAKKLNTPHPNYLKNSCNSCHAESDKTHKKIYNCTVCHRFHIANIADEMLSRKVAIHEKCWQCHESETGKQASENCGMCHNGKKTKF